MQGPRLHKIISVDLDTMMGVCAYCGPVHIKKKDRGTRFSCSISENKHKGKSRSGTRYVKIEKSAVNSECKIKDRKPIALSKKKEIDEARNSLRDVKYVGVVQQKMDFIGITTIKQESLEDFYVIFVIAL